MAEIEQSLREFAVQAGEAKAEYSQQLRALGAAAVRPDILGDPRMADVYADPVLVVQMNLTQNLLAMQQKGAVS